MLPDQAGIWLDQERSGAASAYNIGGAIWIETALDVDAFKTALNLVAGWHEALRLSFTATDAGLMQSVAPSVPVPVEVIDCTAEADPEAAVRRQIELRFNQPFDIERPGLFRFDLLKAGERRWCWLNVYSHLVCDGWGISLITRQVLDAYSTLLSGGTPQRPEGGNWLDHVAQEQSYYSSERCREDAAYWLGIHQPPSPPLFSRRPSRRHGSRASQVSLSRESYARLTEFAKAQGATANSLLLAAIYALFARTEGQWDISIGVPALNRRTAQDKRTVGLFATTNALRCRYAPETRFGDLMRQIGADLRRAYRHQRYPLAELNRQLGLAASGRTQVYDISFSFEPADYGTLADGSRVVAEAVLNREMLDPLAIFVRDYARNPSIDIDFVHNLAYLDEAAADLYAARFLALLDALPDCAETPLESLPVLALGERQRVVVDFNAGSPPCKSPVTVVEGFEAQARRTPEAPAVVCGNEQLSYGELNARANRLARCLQNLGVGPESLVAVCLERSVDLVAALLGILKAGGAYVPLDPGYPRERLAFMLADSGARVVVTAGEMHGLLDPPADCVLLDVAPEPVELAALPSGDLARKPDPASLAYVIYTSGSTGKPKGVSIPHGALAQFFAGSMELGLIRPGDRLLAVTPPSFDIAGLELFGPLLVGGTVVLAGHGEARDAEALAARIAEAKPTVMQATPASWRMLLESGWLPPSGLRLLCGGEAMAGDLAEKLLAAGNLYNLYGPTEATIWATAKVVKRPVESAVVPIGRPYPAVRAYVLDERMNPVGIGVAGELWLGGAHLARGYYNLPALTAEKFVADPFGPPGSRLYRTGDLARWRADGELEFLGRIDHQVKVNGFRIELGEIEACLRSHAGVRDAVAVVREGNAGPYLAAYVTGEAEPGILRAYLEERLPRHMVPQDIVPLDAFPMTPNGKVDRKALPAPPPRTASPEPDQEPLTPTEKNVVEIWEEVLGCGPVSKNDDFFRLGGNSLLAASVLSRIRRSFGVRVPMARFFAEPTVAQLARAVESELGSGEEPDAPASQAKDTVDAVEYPTTPIQEGMWVDRRDAPSETTYSMPVFFHLEGNPAPEAVREALRRLIARHEALRVVLREREGSVVQVLLPEAEPAFEVDLESDLWDVVRREIAQPFDLEHGPLARFHLCRDREGRSVLVANFDHIVVDGRSIGILRREFAEILAGREANLPPVEAGFTALAAMWRASLAGPRGEALREFWRERLKRPALEPLPADPAAKSRGRRLLVEVDEDAAAAVKTLSVRLHVTPMMVWASAVAAVLGRYKGAGHAVAVAMPFACRPEEAFENAVGCFANALPVRVEQAASLKFSDLAAAMKAETLAVMAHQEYPLSWLVRDAAKFQENQAPLFDAAVIVEDDSLLALDDGSSEFGAGKFPLMLTLVRTSRGKAKLAIEYDEGLYSRGRMERLARHIQVSLKDAAARPDDAPVSRLALLPAEERGKVTEEFNATTRPYPRDASLARLFRAAARQHADRIAVSHGSHRLTYRELDRLSDDLARGLLHAGVTPGATVAMAMERGVNAIAVTLAIVKAGGVYLPLDATMPVELASRLMDAAGAKLIVADAHGRERFAHTGADMLDAGTLAIPGDALPEVERSGGDPVYVMFTSGSSGEPKGVVVPHRAVARLVLNAGVVSLDPGDVLAQAAPLGFDAATLEIWSPLLNGGRIAVLDDEVVFDPRKLSASLVSEGVTVMWLTASLFNRVAGEAPECFGSLRRLFTGGEVLSVPHVRKVMEACPRLELFNAYGPTENTTFTTLHRIAFEDLSGPIPIGKPIANTQVLILDEAFQPVPIGVWGELCAAGDGVALGYAARESLTAEKFVTLEDGRRIYRTGDIARWREDGVLEFGGRRDGQIKLRGRRIETGAIETALCALEEIRDAAVVVDRDVLVAVVAADAADDGRWREAVARKLPSFMVPARFVVVPSLPVTANGKKDLRAAAALAAADAGKAAAGAGRAPATAAEALVARLFAEVFGDKATGTIDAGSDFFELGGHSLLAMRLAGLIERATGTRPLIKDILSRRTVAGIAALIGQGASTERLPKAPGPTYPLSSGQARLWVLQRLHPDSGLYNVPVALDLEGPLDVAALSRAFAALEERQHALRLRLAPSAADQAEARQILALPGALRLEVVDLSSSPDPAAAADERLSQEVARPFVLERDAPARAVLLKLGAERWRLIVVLHHSVCDGWSAPVLLRDLGALYAGLPLAPLDRGYEDFAAWQHAWLESADAKEKLERWRRRLDPLPAPLLLPTDHSRPAVRRGRGGWADFTLEPETARRLSALAAASGGTPFMALLALVQVLLYRHSGQNDICLGTLSAGRDRAELAEMVGFFVNTLALRQQIDPAATFRALLEKTRSTLLDALADGDCPFEAVVDAVQAPRDTSRNPLFDVLAVWQDEDPRPPALPGVKAAFIDVPFPFSKFDLEFYFQASGGGIRARVMYDADLFEAGTIAAMLRRFEVLAAAAVANPDSPIEDLPWMSEDEARLVLDGFNATAIDLPVRQTVPQPFLAQAAARGEATAVLTDGETLTYRAFARRAGAVAAALAARGVEPGSVVAVCARRSVEMLAAIQGVLLAGAAYAPIDPDYPAARRNDMLADLGHPLVVASAQCAGLFPPDRVVVPEARDADPVCRAVNPDDLAYVIYTSGSTGRPKGVAIEHHSVLNRILWMQRTLPIGPGDVILQKTPVTFDVSVWELFWWSWTGAAVALAPLGAEKDPAALAAAVERFGVTVMHFVPSMLAEFLAALEDGRVAPERLRSLRYVFASGEALDVQHVERFNRLLHGPYGVELHNLYGPTEATVDVTWHPCSPWRGGETVPIGRPVANTRILILGSDGRPVPVGVPGEICIGGPQVARGYVNRPELTAERFIKGPANTGRIYRTGDRGRWLPGGEVEYLGRLDHQVKIRGFRVECGEVEHALESHAAVERAIVVPAQAGGLTELHAYVLGSAVSSADLRAHLRSKLPEYMVPARFFRLDSLPLTSSGKVDRKKLSGRPLDVTTDAIPATAVEAEVMAIWREVLPHATFGLHDGFFDAGGNSLLLLRLHERLERRWPGVFTVASLFACATVAEQARRIAPAGVASQAKDAVAPKATSAPIAIIGMAVRLADFEDLASFWRDLAGAVDRVRPLPEKRAAEARALLAAMGRKAPALFREAAYLEDIYSFDPSRFRMAPADAALVDPEQRVFYETALAALEDAGYGGTALDGRRIGVFVGASPSHIYAQALDAILPEKHEQIFALNVPSNAATRLSFLKNWSGPAMMVDTACSASLTAVHLACTALRRGECEAALVGAAKVMLAPPDAGNRMMIDSSTARTRAFAAGADGTGMGEGAVAFLLKPLDRAVADGDAIHAVILGSALNQDGASSGMAAPNPVAQAAVIRAAAQDAGIGLDSLSYVEAHGTGTELGDPIEVEGLTQAFSGTPGGVALGSVKGNYGHLDNAAGALGLAKAVLCLRHGQAPPQPFFEAPNPRIDFANAPVAVPRSLTPLVRRQGRLRAGVSAFGLSGINAHVVIEEPPAAPAPQQDKVEGLYVVALSAGSREALRRYAEALREAAADANLSIPAIAYTLATGRSHLRYRIAAAVRTREDLLEFPATGEASEAPPQRGSRTVVPAFAASENEARAAVAAYLAGADLSWPDEAGRPRRLHLPPAPFTRQVCRPEFPVNAGSQTGSTLGAPVATRDGHAFAVPVHAADFWPVAEHRLEGQPTLAGLAIPGLLADAARALGIAEELEIRDLRWLRKVRPAELAENGVSLHLKPQDGTWRAELGGRTRTGEWVELATATVAPLADPPVAVDLAALRRRCPVVVPVRPFTAEVGAVSVSRRWDCLVGFWTSPDQNQGLVHLRLPAAYAGDLASYRQHPALLDVAASVGLGVPRVPVGCAAVRIFDSLPSEVLAHVIRRQSGGDVLEVDVSLYDPNDGRVRVVLAGLRFLALRSETVPLSTIVWQPAPLAETAPAARVLVAGSGVLADRLADALSRSGRLAGRARNAEEILASQASDIALVTDSAEPLWSAADLLRQLMTGLKRKLRVVMVGSRAFSIGEADATPNPGAALLAGLTLSASQEEPMLALRYLDIDENSPADLVAAEFAAFDTVEAQPLAVVRNGRRYQRSLAPLTGGGAIRWPAAGCCVVTGGSGGFALALAEEFAGHGKLALALLSRTGDIAGRDAEARDRKARLAALERSGIRVRSYACDVTNRAQLAATLERVRSELGPITAVVHAAGEADGGFLVNRRREAFDSVVAVKVEGAQNLDALTREDPVEAFVLFASVTGLAGAPGQTAYAAANAWLDAFAEWRRRQGRPALAIDWCTLSGIGMAARHGADKLPGTVITPAQAPDIWRRILATSSAQVVVADARQTTPVTPQTTPATPAPKTPERSISTQESAPAAAPAPKAPARATGMLESALAVLWAEILGYDSVDPEEDFYALGGDSISGMQIVSRIQSDLGYTIRVPDLLEAGTVKALAELLRRKAAPKEAGIEPAPEMPAYPVGWEQRDVLRAEASAEMGTAFNLPTLLELPETLSTERLTAALTELVARHEVLRTRFREEGDDWVMEVLPASPVTLPEIDLPVNGDIALACQSRVRPFDFTSQPPVRFELLRLPGGRRMLFFDLHHSLADGFTVELLAAELAALCAGKALPAPARQLKDYAWWSRKGGGAKAREEARKYWLEIYRGELPRLELPTDRPRPPIHTWRGGTASFEIDPGVVKRLRAFASEHRVTPFVVVLSAWSAVLAKIAASEDIVIGVPVDNRDRSGLENMPGMMVSLLPLRLAVRGSDRVGGLLERVQAAHAGAMRHRAFGLGSLLEELAPPAAPDRTWLSEVTLSYMNFAEGSRDGGFPMVGLLRDSIKGDLSIYVRDLPERILVSIEYYADVFDAERIERLGASFETLLASLVNGTADTPIGNLPVVPAAEERRLRAFENGAQPPLPWGRGLAALFAERARECPDRVAVEDARFCWTYRELASHANGVAHRLIEAGVRPGDLVALAMDRGAEAIAALLGIVTAGAGYVPLELDYPQERNRVILADAGVAVVIADAAGRAALGPVAGITVFASEELMEMTAEEPPEIDWSGDPDAAPAYLMYTSGSTGQPKGVLVPQRAVVRISLGDDFAALGPEDRVLQCGPLAFDASTWEVWGPLLKGARLAIATREEILDPAAFEAALDRYGTTALFLTASLFNRQVDRDPSVFKRVRVLVSGGEAMSAVHAGRLLEACPNVRLVNGYGPTENTTFTTFHRVRREDVTGMGIPIGQPIAHSRAVILDGNGRRVPIGVWGEICAGGPGLADGYWKRPDLTAERFIPDPENPGERLYRTGDLGRWRSDGVIEYGGRRDTQIKLRGIRIELDEIEQVLHRHPAVARAAVLFENDELTACLVLKSGAGPVSDIDMRAWLGRMLPAAMVPAHWVVVPEIPVNSNGKIDRERLSAVARQATPLASGRAAEAPRTETEARIAEAFSAVLGRPVEDRNASFLDLGGHSLQAIRVVNQIAKSTGVRLRMADFFAAGALAELARRVEEAAGNRESRILPAPKAEFYPASHAQQRLYLLHRMDPTSAAYNMAFSFRCDGNLDPAAFAAALGGLVARHETLRTVFEEIDGAVVQRIVPEAFPAVEVDDLTSRPDAKAEALRLARREVSTPFDLSRAPLVRARIMRVSQNENFVLLLLDHIAADGWSSRILVKELGALYRAAVSGTEANLPPLAATYKDYAVWQDAQDWTAASQFWQRKLAGAPDGIALPTTRPLPEVQSYRGASCRRWLSAEVMDGLRELARRHGVTVAAVGMALFAALLYRLTRQRDMVLGMGVAGRDRAELEGQIGFFVNVLPIRLELEEQLELAQLIRQTHAAMLEALDRRDYPFDLLVRDVAPRRQANRQPLVNVVFEYQRFGALNEAAGDGLPLLPASAGGPEDEEMAALIGSATAKHDMILFFRDEGNDGDEALLILEHDTDILDAATAAEWLAYYCRFAEAAAATELSHK